MRLFFKVLPIEGSDSWVPFPSIFFFDFVFLPSYLNLLVNYFSLDKSWVAILVSLIMIKTKKKKRKKEEENWCRNLTMIFSFSKKSKK